jgi:ABC-2 type transport system ATP-binding protein
MPAELIVTDLHKSYGPVAAVRGVTLEADAGEIFGLLGPNGAGKTTTIECILGLRLPDSGSIRISGIDALKHPEQIKLLIGAQLQATALQDKITPREALTFFGAFYRNAIKPDPLIERFALGEKADKPFDSLSAGQKQRLALALAFVNEPRLVFLDEPTAGLDPQARRELHEQILQLKAEGRTVVLSTHHIEEAEKLCDRLAIINAGQIAATGTPAQLLQQANLPDHVSVRTAPDLTEEMIQSLSDADGMQRANHGWLIPTRSVNRLVIGLVKLIETRGVELVDLQIRRATLEDAYLKTVGGSRQG